MSLSDADVTAQLDREPSFEAMATLAELHPSNKGARATHTTAKVVAPTEIRAMDILT
jgi:hypothetical protein